METRAASRTVGSYAVPAVGLATLAWTATGSPTHPVVLLAVAVLVACVLAAVTHAEVIARRIGEPLGAIVLALSVTVIEAGLIISLMAAHHGETDSLARDTVFAAVMVVTSGVIGLSIVLAAWRRSVVRFQRAGTGGLLAMLLIMGSLTLVLPRFTTETPGPTFSNAQLIFAAVACLSLYAFFVFFQAVSRPEDFQPLGLPEAASDHADLLVERPTRRQALRSLLLLLACLVAVVGIAEGLSTPLEELFTRAGAPQSAIGLVIALLVLLPESLTALRAARRDQLQTSINLSLGSAIASIGLTIPTVAIISVALDRQLILGLSPAALVLFAITGLLSAITLTSGEVTLLQGAIHLVLFATFAFLAFNP